MDIVVNDTNVFIDLISVNLLEETFRLPINFHTVDYIINEISDEEQRAAVDRLIQDGRLFVKEFNENESLDIIGLYETRSNNVSVADCSVWYYAKKNDYRLITGDGKLRSSATADGVIVSGILFLTDMLIEYNLVSKRTMANKLRQLSLINKRLPKRLVEERIAQYENLL